MSGQRVTESRHWCDLCNSETHCEIGDDGICVCETCSEIKDGRHA